MRRRSSDPKRQMRPVKLFSSQEQIQRDKRNNSRRLRILLRASLTIPVVLLASVYWGWLVPTLDDASVSAAFENLSYYGSTSSLWGEQRDKYHIVFSSSCSEQQDWQSYLFFYQAFQLKQRGRITRIISGCTEEEEMEQRKVEKHIKETMSDRFGFHFTKDFGNEDFGDRGHWQTHKYFNKPFGVRHWLENAYGFPSPHRAADEDTIVVLVDPDMILLRPFENNFANYPSQGLWSSYIDEPRTRVSHGHPIAQKFMYSNGWLVTIQDNITYVVGNDSPVHNVSLREAADFYPAGPPYVLTMKDMYAIAVKWTEFASKVYSLNQNFMSEMYGYSLAAAHLGLKHQLAVGFMISSPLVASNGEGWGTIDTTPLGDVCKDIPAEKLPMTLHYCQRYGIGEFFFSKYKIRHNFLSCSEELMMEPPSEPALLYNYSHFGDGSIHSWHRKTYMRVRHAFMICNMIQALNGAATFYKKHNCDPEDANYNKTFHFFDENGNVLK